MKFCCALFEQEATSLQAPVGGGLYPPAVRPKAQFVQDRHGAWHINGCCGGGCYVVSDMKFCPFCGTTVKSPEVGN